MFVKCDIKKSEPIFFENIKYADGLTYVNGQTLTYNTGLVGCEHAALSYITCYASGNAAGSNIRVTIDSTTGIVTFKSGTAYIGWLTSYTPAISFYVW